MVVLNKALLVLPVVILTYAYLLATIMIVEHTPLQRRFQEQSDHPNHRRLRIDQFAPPNQHLSPLPRAPLSSADVALCLIVKDDIDLEEWLQYHVALGVGIIYVFDNNSTYPRLIPMLHPYIVSGHVVYRYLSEPLPPGTLQGMRSKQLYAYQQCLREFGKRHEFMGFIDSDEFIVVKSHSLTLLDILADYRGYGGLTLNWMMFGSSGHISRPAGGVLSSYSHCRPDHHLKSIVNLRFVRGISVDPHHFEYKDGYFAVDTNFTRVPGAHNPALTSGVPSHLYEKIYLNHYFKKSKEDFLRKVQRGHADSSVPRSVHLIERIDAECSSTCELLRMPDPVNR